MNFFKELSNAVVNGNEVNVIIQVGEIELNEYHMISELEIGNGNNQFQIRTNNDSCLKFTYDEVPVYNEALGCWEFHSGPANLWMEIIKY